jgi:hypothetical protein
MGMTLRNELYASGGIIRFATDEDVGGVVVMGDVDGDEDAALVSRCSAAATAFSSCSLFKRFSFFFPIPAGAPTVCGGASWVAGGGNEDEFDG